MSGKRWKSSRGKMKEEGSRLSTVITFIYSNISRKGK
jgi:hypothetical protein